MHCVAWLLLCRSAHALQAEPLDGWRDATALRAVLSAEPATHPLPVRWRDATALRAALNVKSATHPLPEQCPGCPLVPSCQRVWRRIVVGNETTSPCKGKLQVAAARYYPIIPPYDVAPKARGVFDSCALVSNGGVLLKSGCGPAIDSNDAVWRANTPRLAGYEADVGARTTHRVLNNIEVLRFAWNDSAFNDSSMTTISMLAPAVSHRVRFTRRAKAVPGFERVWQATQTYKEDLRRFWMARTHNNATLKATSGLCMLAHAATACRVINMFGFGIVSPDELAASSAGLAGSVRSFASRATASSLQLPYHFWDDTVSESEHRLNSTNHDFDLEHMVFRELASSWPKPGICVREPRAEPLRVEVQRMEAELKTAERKRSKSAAQRKLLKASNRSRVHQH